MNGLPSRYRLLPFAGFARETITIVDNIGLSVDQRGSEEETISAIQHYVQGQVNKSVERRNFRKQVQQPGETF